jgi:hypothetical protein
MILQFKDKFKAALHCETPPRVEDVVEITDGAEVNPLIFYALPDDAQKIVEACMTAHEWLRAHDTANTPETTTGEYGLMREHENYDRIKWEDVVMSGDTELGYWDWVKQEVLKKRAKR